jgi:hypothetical protein
MVGSVILHPGIARGVQAGTTGYLHDTLGKLTADLTHMEEASIAVRDGICQDHHDKAMVIDDKGTFFIENWRLSNYQARFEDHEEEEEPARATRTAKRKAPVIRKAKAPPVVPEKEEGLVPTDPSLTRGELPDLGLPSDGPQKARVDGDKAAYPENVQDTALSRGVSGLYVLFNWEGSLDKRLRRYRPYVKHMVDIVCRNQWVYSKRKFKMMKKQENARQNEHGSKYAPADADND